MVGDNSFSRGQNRVQFQPGLMIEKITTSTSIYKLQYPQTRGLITLFWPTQKPFSSFSWRSLGKTAMVFMYLGTYYIHLN